MRIKSILKLFILLLTFVLAFSSVGCTPAVEEADVLGLYVKEESDNPMIFRTGQTEISISGTEGVAYLELQEENKAFLEYEEGGAFLGWSLDNGTITLYFTNAVTSGNFISDKINDLGGPGMVWAKK